MSIKELEFNLNGRLSLTKGETAQLFGVHRATLRRYLISWGMHKRLRNAKRLYKQDLIAIQARLYGVDG